MDQTHIGYTYWQQPAVNKMPAVTYIKKADIIQPQKDNTAKKLVSKQRLKKQSGAKEFYQKDGYISIEAENYSRSAGQPEISWVTIPNLGRTGSAVTPYPVTANRQTPGGNSARLEYVVHTEDTGLVKLHTYLSPTLDFTNSGGLNFAVSIDDEKPQIINMHVGESRRGTWDNWVANNINIMVTEHRVPNKGKHTVKYWMVDPGIVVQKFVLDMGGLQTSYLGPEETLVK